LFNRSRSTKEFDKNKEDADRKSMAAKRGGERERQSGELAMRVGNRGDWIQTHDYADKERKDNCSLKEWSRQANR